MAIAARPVPAIGDPLYLSGDDAPDRASRSPLWWPSAKVVGRHLTGYLAGGRTA